MTTRLYVIMARRARTAVVFRRGPSKRVRLLRWDLTSDRFDPGQWFKGRVYERRCDLSPDGSKLIYFAANWKPGHASWTGVSKLPWFTALALWPKGDAWGGGGLFETDAAIGLNHAPHHMELAPGFKLHRRMRVARLAPWAGRGEDDPIWDMRLRRDGWAPVGEPLMIQHPYGSAVWIEYDPPIVYAKPSPRSGEVLEMRVRGIKQKDGPWYIVDHAIRGGRDLLGSEWADWDDNGDLLWARDGRLFRADRELIDLRDQRFEELPPPPAATQWLG